MFMLIYWFTVFFLTKELFQTHCFKSNVLYFRSFESETINSTLISIYVLTNYVTGLSLITLFSSPSRAVDVLLPVGREAGL